jgi:hypothetical protein
MVGRSSWLGEDIASPKSSPYQGAQKNPGNGKNAPICWLGTRTRSTNQAKRPAVFIQSPQRGRRLCPAAAGRDFAGWPILGFIGLASAAVQR